jgi:MerR family transcriptional regulator, light-induced transcriptional regulator
VQFQSPAARTAVSVPRSPPPEPDPSPEPDVLANQAADPVLQLTVAAVARRLGVAPATLRTWDRRYGIGPVDHVPGRPRRYSPEDVARLEMMRQAMIQGATPADAAVHARTAPLPPADPALIGPARVTSAPEATARNLSAQSERPNQARHNGRSAGASLGRPTLRLPGADRRARGLGRAALALDSDLVRELLTESIAAVGLQRTWDDVTRPVLSAVAHRWADTGVGIEIEHLLSDCVTGVFSTAVSAAPKSASGARPVLLAGVPQDQHLLPLVVLAATLAQRRITCRSLGADLPVAAMASAIRRLAPAAVVLWSQLSSTANPTILQSLPRTRPEFRTFAAGPGWAQVQLPPRVMLLTSLLQATDVIGAAIL